MEAETSWYQNWLSQQPVVCVAGKEPPADKVQTFCRHAEGGQGCPNLVPACALNAKRGTVFGKRKIPQVGLNVCVEE